MMFQKQLISLVCLMSFLSLFCLRLGKKDWKNMNTGEVILCNTCLQDLFYLKPCFAQAIRMFLLPKPYQSVTENSGDTSLHDALVAA